MSILSGFFKTKRYRKTTDGYKLESNWTSGNTVELDDGNTVQNNLGAIKGITTSTSVTEQGYAADATTVAAINNSLGTHNHDSRYYTESEMDTKLNNLFVYEDIQSATVTVASKSYVNIAIKNSLTKSGYVYDHASIINSGGNYCTYAVVSLNAYNNTLSATIYNPIDGGLSIGLTVRIVWKKA